MSKKLCSLRQRHSRKLFVAVYARSPEDLPSDDELAAQINAMGKRLKQLRQASLVERYTGPVIFLGQAATELFNQGFVPYVLATRRALSDNPPYASYYPQKKENSFLDKIGVRGIDQSTGSRSGPGNILVEAEKGLSEKDIRKESLVRALTTNQTPVKALALSSVLGGRVGRSARSSPHRAMAMPARMMPPPMSWAGMGTSPRMRPAKSTPATGEKDDAVAMSAGRTRLMPANHAN